MKASSIPHCSYFDPAITISELQDVISVISIISPCNMGQCEGGEAILSLFVSLTRQEDSVVHSINPHSPHWSGQPGRGDLLPVRAGSEQLSGVKIFDTMVTMLFFIIIIMSTRNHQHLKIGSLVYLCVTLCFQSHLLPSSGE